MATKPIVLSSKQFNHDLMMRLAYAEKLDAKYKEPHQVKLHLKFQNKLKQWNQVALDRLASTEVTLSVRDAYDYQVIE